MYSSPAGTIDLVIIETAVAGSAVADTAASAFEVEMSSLELIS